MSSSGKKYDVSGNVESQYVDAEQQVLLNRLGIQNLHELQVQEEEGLAQAYEALFAEVRIDTPVTCQFICHVHQRIFGALFEWAGRWRTVQISKPGAIWPAAQFLDASMQEFERSVLLRFPATSLSDDESFFAAAGQIQGEFLAIHPFREGNARTIKLVTDLIAAQCGRPLLRYDATPAGTHRYIEAARAALLRKDYSPMADVIRMALAAARSG